MIADGLSRIAMSSGLATSLSLARILAEYATYYGDPGKINTEWDRLSKFSAADDPSSRAWQCA